MNRSRIANHSAFLRIALAILLTGPPELRHPRR
jgi:hypothetical protein